MKAMYRILLFMICTNLAAYLGNYIMDLTGLPKENVDTLIQPSQIAEQFNATSAVQSWSTYTSMFSYVGDVVAGLVMAVNAVKTFLFGFPDFLAQIGVPTVLVLVLNALWCFVWAWGVWEWIAGRRAHE